MGEKQSIEDFLNFPKTAGIEIGYFNEEDAFVAWANETGYGNRPPRPFLRPVMESSEWKNYQSEQAGLFFLGDISKEELKNRLFNKFKSLLTIYIKNPYNFTPNAQSTVARKGTNTPLLINYQTRFLDALDVREDN